MKTITKQREKEYLENPGRCPHCNSEQTGIVPNTEEFLNERAWRDCQCDTCQERWKEIFRLHHLETRYGEPLVSDNVTLTQNDFLALRKAIEKASDEIESGDPETASHLMEELKAKLIAFDPEPRTETPAPTTEPNICPELFRQKRTLCEIRPGIYVKSYNVGLDKFYHSEAETPLSALNFHGSPARAWDHFASIGHMIEIEITVRKILNISVARL